VARLKPAQCDFGHGLWRNNRLVRPPERAFRAFVFAPEQHPTPGRDANGTRAADEWRIEQDAMSSNSICQDLRFFGAIDQQSHGEL